MSRARNGLIDLFFGTCKEQLLSAGRFDTLGESAEALEEFSAR